MIGSRIKHLAAASIVAAAFAYPSQGGSAESIAPVTFRATPDHRGLFDSKAPALKRVIWKYALRGRVYGSPIVAGGVVYIGVTARKFYAIDAATGTLRWAAAMHGSVASTPAYAQGIVYTTSIDGTIYALDAAKGTTIWTFRTLGDRRYTVAGIHGEIPSNEVMPDPFDIFTSSPTISDGTLYVGSGDGNVYALDASSGTLRWKFATGDVVHASPTVDGGIVYVGSWDRNFYAIDAKTGALRWKYQTGDDPVKHNMMGNGSSAAVSDGVVYFGSRDAHFYALDARTGSLLWKHDDEGSWVMSSPAVHDDTVCFVTSDEHTFEVLDAKTGVERFHISNATFSFSSPSIAGDYAYYGTFDGIVKRVDLKAGRVVDRFESDAATRDRQAHMGKDGTLDLRTFGSDGTYEGLIVAVDRIFALGSVVGEVAIANGVAYFGTTDGTLYAVR